MEKFYSFLSFLWRFFAANLLWLVPTFYCCVLFHLIWIFFLPFLITYVYISWAHYDQRKPLTVQRTAKTIDVFYKITVVLFLALTGVSTYQGIVDVFGITGWFYKTFVIFFAGGIVTALWLLTLMIKSRKTPAVILGLFCLYILFDGLTALPYNFLFFYSYVQRADHVTIDKAHINEVFSVCDTLFKHREDAAVTDLKTLNAGRKRQEHTDTARRNRNLINGRAGLKYQLEHNLIQQETYDSKMAYLLGHNSAENVNYSDGQNKALSAAEVKKNDYDRIILQLAACKKLKDALDNTSNTDEAANLCSQLKDNLIVLCNHPQEKGLAEKSDLLFYPKKTPLEAVKDLYRFFSVIFQMNNRIPVARRNAADAEDGMLLNVSLASSIVIDILPLLLSILYAKFSRND